MGGGRIMNNAERIARDICLLAGQYERGEITAKEFVVTAENCTMHGCAGCAYKYTECNNHSCFDGRAIWLEAEAES